MHSANLLCTFDQKVASMIIITITFFSSFHPAQVRLHHDRNSPNNYFPVVLLDNLFVKVMFLASLKFVASFQFWGIYLKLIQTQRISVYTFHKVSETAPTNCLWNILHTNTIHQIIHCAPEKHKSNLLLQVLANQTEQRWFVRKDIAYKHNSSNLILCSRETQKKPSVLSLAYQTEQEVIP